jgi:DNA polymerase
MIAGTQIPAGPGYATVLPDMDFEAFSAAGYYWDGPADRYRGVAPDGKGGLPVVGAPVYCEHPSTEIISLAYDLKDGDGPRLWIPGQPPPVELFNHIAAGGLVEAWNSSFEYMLWRYVCEARMGWPEFPLNQLRCAMAKARAWSLPGKLEKAADAIDAQERKDPKGDALIRKLCIPRSPTKKDRRHRRTPADEPDDFRDMYAYNVQDIRAEASVSMRTPDLQPQELELWLIDQEINQRGVHIDTDALDACISIVNQAHAKYCIELQEITDHFIQSADEIDKIGNWLRYKGVSTDSVDADAVKRLLKSPDLPADCRRVLEIRQSLGSRSVKKLFSINHRLSADGRLRELFAFCGADRTGRFAGRGPQPQNLPNSGPAVVKCSHCGQIRSREVLLCPTCFTLQGPGDGIEWGVEAVDSALALIATRSLATVEKFYPDALAAVKGCLRGLFCAAPGKELICSDYSSIEAVVLAALAGEEWRLDVFRTHGKIYEMSAAAITGIPFEELMAHKARTGEDHPARKTIGKVAELASGYCGWIGAWKNFGADKYFNDDEIKQHILAWRDASPAIVEFWGGQWRKDPTRWHFEPELYGLEGAAVQAVQNPGQCYRYREITYGVKDDVLYCRLPSGRLLNYHKPRLTPGMAPHKHPILELSYMGFDSYTRKWTRLGTYGGKLAENVTQASSRDVFTHAFPALERAGYPIVLHTHDEPASEVPEGYGSIEEYEAIMMRLPAWCHDWPIKAAGGWRGHRYRK